MASLAAPNFKVQQFAPVMVMRDVMAINFIEYERIPVTAAEGKRERGTEQRPKSCER